MKLTFGKYKGEEIKDIPVSYLSWLLTSNFINSITRNAITESLASRKLSKSKKKPLSSRRGKDLLGEPIRFNTGPYFGREPRNCPRVYLERRYNEWRETIWSGSLHSELMEEIQKVLYVDPPWPKPPTEEDMEPASVCLNELERLKEAKEADLQTRSDPDFHTPPWI
jgi:hypothetical protein